VRVAHGRERVGPDEEGEAMEIRRVVTGTRDGKAVVVADEPVEPATVALMPGSELHAIWGSDATVELPSDGTPPTAAGWFPPVGGFRFLFFTLPPAGAAPGPDLDTAAAEQEMREKLPGLLEVLEPDSPGMHTTDTVDVVHILSGAVTLELDEGMSVELAAGDVVVQNGTRHAWHNRSAEPCLMVAAQVGASRPG
jgi:mannose-6-phosphate isomerase-like protein (cupin superfamily)